MARVIRPIQFDPPRKATRREKARLAQRRRRKRQFEPGGNWFYPAFMQRMVREPWDMMLSEPANNNFRR